MNKYILIFLVVAGGLIFYKQSEVKKEELRAEQKKVEERRRAEQKKVEERRRAEQKKVEERRRAESPICNTKLGIIYSNCGAMYNIYKEKYTAMITPDGKPNAIANILCGVRLMVTEQDKRMYEEKCDEIVYPKIRQAIFGIACYQLSRGIKMMYKSEYCRIYKNADEYIRGGLK
jgi:hypothetical protein